MAEGLINIDLLDKSLGNYANTMWERYKSMFREIREMIPDPFLGEYFQFQKE